MKVISNKFHFGSNLSNSDTHRMLTEVQWPAADGGVDPHRHLGSLISIFLLRQMFSAVLNGCWNKFCYDTREWLQSISHKMFTSVCFCVFVCFKLLLSWTLSLFLTALSLHDVYQEDEYDDFTKQSHCVLHSCFRQVWNSVYICAMSFWCWAFSRSLTNSTPMKMPPSTGEGTERCERFETSLRCHFLSKFSCFVFCCFQTSGFLYNVKKWRWAADVQALRCCKSYETHLYHHNLQITFFKMWNLNMKMPSRCVIR